MSRKVIIDGTTRDFERALVAELSDIPATPASYAMGGDVSGTTAAATVVGLQGRAVASTAPSDGYAPVWNAAAGQYQPGPVKPPYYPVPFTDRSGNLVTDSTGNLAFVRVYDL